MEFALKKVVIFGLGYTAQHFVRLLINEGYEVFATSRDKARRDFWQNQNVNMFDFSVDNAEPLLQGADAILVTTPPDNMGRDPVYLHFYNALLKFKNTIKWLGYLSTTGVYGDHKGAWVNELSTCQPSSLRSQNRIKAENNWLTMFSIDAIPVHVFRLSGIYGSGRNSLERLRAGKNFSIVKPGHVFSRIHVEDICSALLASINNPTPGEIFNLADDLPAAPQELDIYSARLLNLKPPKLIPIEQANLSAMALEFYSDNKRVSHAKIRKILGFENRYPSYKEGLNAIFNEK